MTTSDLYFGSKENPPADSEMKTALGSLHPAYAQVIKHIDGYLQEWKFYGAKYGWQLKVSNEGKALFYLIPRGGSFSLAFAVREHEKASLQKSKLPAGTRKELASAKKYAEGYALRLHIAKPAGVKTALTVIDLLKKLRG
jgi:hypothetical protein